ncbi:Benzoyl-CoA reductase/2-hydroxyglutaryl-CoA dehydratase subunit, BcrC/BadD/HgdB [Thermosyntropha lipolytica DSM 11003]|uniref:Benzoyl-CoA reductase/2-hydroxyglutaryl-CoA dehydratase subunit, BcrC/BadD/HgdB n=1 Tax=Thermosyntropha lipolytica DSM 11003 TaxID=1123382 RepID=A0A1M5MSV0_9FIRM|nr:2-hydroxyacyl-CoA dehydratase [Thermosyntropha lipolytica]SHG80255.1 Benzoyl-CoA reductase/2-hydroxyglutaryl-CoA dehydratase subunit, BcrC/BadD/HgdB [Thermosyntropha lipolytica DSM 11003]
MGRIGFTTTIPVEIILAAGKEPVDLNNVFITSTRAGEMVEMAEEAGYPRNTCGWIKGLYAAALENDLEAVIAVMHGDCSNTLALMETLEIKGIKIIPFAFPYVREREMIEHNINRLMNYFGVSSEQVEQVRKRLDAVRRLCHKIDEMTWKDNLVSGFENHYYLVSSSDFNGDPEKYEEEIKAFIARASRRQPYKDTLRLAYIGVPPIFTDLYQVLEEMGARVVYNEVQRQFAMPFVSDDIYEQYLKYTYPYGAFARLEDIQQEIERRGVDGVIHYTQTFCFRQIEDLIYREKIKLPFLTLEGDKPGKLDARSRMRLEAFINMLKR